MSSLFSSLKRQPVLRSRTPNTVSPPKPTVSSRSIFSSKSRRHTPTLPDLTEEDEDTRSPLPSPSIASSSTIHLSPTSTPRTSRSMKRLSKYGKADFQIPEGDDGVFTAPRPAPSPPKPKQEEGGIIYVSPLLSPVSLSDFEFDETAPSTTSPVLPSSPYASPPRTPTTSERPRPAIVARSPTESVSSVGLNGSSSSEGEWGYMPRTPTSSDDERFPMEFYVGTDSPVIVPRRASIHPLVINKSSPPLPVALASVPEYSQESEADDEMDDILDAYEFTIPESSMPSPPLQPESVEEDEAEDSDSDDESYISDDGLFYALAHSGYDLTTSATSSSIFTRPDSLPPTPRRTSLGPARRSSIPSLRRRRSSLQSIRATCKPVPSSQLDPTFPRRRSSLRSSLPPKPTRVPPPVPSFPSTLPSPALVRRDSPNSLRNKKSLSIIVPRRGSHDSTASDVTCTEGSRPPPKESLPDDVFELLDDASGWVCDRSPSSPSPSQTTDASMTEESEVPKTPTSSSDEGHSGGGRRERQGSFGLPVPSSSPLALNFLQVDAALSHPFTPAITLAPAPSPTSSASPPSSPITHSPLNLPYFLRDSYLDRSPSNTSDSFDHDDEEDTNWDITNDRVLRSRWSSSTLSTVVGRKEEGSMSALLKSHFTFGKRGRSSASANKVQVREKASPEKKVPIPTIQSPKKSATPDVSFNTSSSPSPSPSPTSAFFAPFLSPSSHVAKRSSDIPGRAQKRMGMAGMGMGLGMGRKSMDSVLSKASSESSASEEESRLRRKPIPFEMLTRQ
ncbi:uncharacterized protein STEHIDRAFT_171536 [Stereum hirsutum FP-91666 SS1]|uniref:uncharacterized protein n=1 Tax=Stereum hirsutum (strain FP-91666) TaxID=721885 RepID=UPI000444A5B9|nr:uncharacterized protein STEHIDRAFT_171536 [Stereum hirsutum FP-91666 SS1]EIM81897.1 hypothetical protein STEHIDRAFT_171536 [Stereum hirsutum FP-91666 SS1]